MAKKQNADPPSTVPAAKPQRRTTKGTTSGNGDVKAPLATHARPEPSYDDIAQAAYLRYLSRGAAPGGDFDDWLEAERDLRRKG